MLVDAARESTNPNLRAIIFRQQFTQMTDIVDKTLRLYKPMGANFVGAPTWTWTFPSGAKIRLEPIIDTSPIAWHSRHAIKYLSLSSTRCLFSGITRVRPVRPLGSQ